MTMLLSEMIVYAPIATRLQSHPSSVYRMEECSRCISHIARVCTKHNASQHACAYAHNIRIVFHTPIQLN
jgi:hypothetical protein